MPKLFKFGGCVRDSFLGIDSKDIDFTFVLDNLDQSVEQGFSDMETWMMERKFKIFP
jgi:tRNA nucleotidyltransferase/poly(A) polymerase